MYAAMLHAQHVHAQQVHMAMHMQQMEQIAYHQQQQQQPQQHQQYQPQFQYQPQHQLPLGYPHEHFQQLPAQPYDSVTCRPTAPPGYEVKEQLDEVEGALQHLPNTTVTPSRTKFRAVGSRHMAKSDLRSPLADELYGQGALLAGLGLRQVLGVPSPEGLRVPLGSSLSPMSYSVSSSGNSPELLMSVLGEVIGNDLSNQFEDASSETSTSASDSDAFPWLTAVQQDLESDDEEPQPLYSAQRQRVARSPLLPTPEHHPYKRRTAAAVEEPVKEEPNSPAKITPVDYAESAANKAAYRKFYKEFRAIEKADRAQAREFALRAFNTLPSQIHWRIFVELADLCKRGNDLASARQWFRKANRAEPFAPQAWLEHAKLEEECGELATCEKILSLALMFCKFNESVMIKAIKVAERRGKPDVARSVLARLRNVHVDKVWRTLLEGALFEARQGNYTVARRVFAYLMKHVGWYGPVYAEACRFEEAVASERVAREQQLHGDADLKHAYWRALAVTEAGLDEVPRYGPLWFSAFRLHERVHGADAARELMDKALTTISSELRWKVHHERGMLEIRGGKLEAAREAFSKAVIASPKNLRWKVWLTGARLELLAGREAIARKLQQRAREEAPKKMRAVPELEASRLEEFCGNVDQARQILVRAQEATPHEWKLFLEAVLLEVRTGDIDAAIQVAERAIEEHAGTGRLWAILIRLKSLRTPADSAQHMADFERAIGHVPKSGEVWNEGARLLLDPTSPYFNLRQAKDYLCFALQFTPQYGDSFVEYLRLEMLLKGRYVGIDEQQAGATTLYQRAINADPNYGSMWLHCKELAAFGSVVDTLNAARPFLVAHLAHHKSLYQRAILDNWTKRRGSSATDEAAHAQASRLGQDAVQQFKLGQREDLHRLFPVLQPLTAEERHRALFAADSIM